MTYHHQYGTLAIRRQEQDELSAHACYLSSGSSARAEVSQ